MTTSTTARPLTAAEYTADPAARTYEITLGDVPDQPVLITGRLKLIPGWLMIMHGNVAIFASPSEQVIKCVDMG